MKKRLLFALVAMCVTVSGFALTKNEFVYTPQGRFQITGDNLNANNAFQDMTGWTIVSASADKTLADNFVINANGLAEGFNSVKSLDATAGEGMYYKFEPTDASATYVVSYKLKGATAVDVRVKTVAVSTNLVKVEGNSDNVYGGSNDVLLANTAEELSENWQTFNYAIQGDGTARTYFISFTGMADNIEIADLQIATAMQFADLRQRDAMLEKLNVYKNCYNWADGVLDEYSMNEAIANLEAIGDNSGQADLDVQIETAKEILAEFLDKNMDDYLAGGGNRDNYFDTWRTKIQKWSQIGDWTCLPAGRGFWEKADQDCVDLGHYQNGATWNGGAPTTPMGVYMQKTLDPGSYVFSIDASAALREPKKSDWNNDDGLRPAYGVAYIVKVVEGADPDTIASVVKDLEPVVRKTFLVPATITEAGTYEIGFKSYCKESHQSLSQGSVTYVANASIWGKNENQYNQKQLGYEADVREQITAGRDNLTTAKENIANADYFWGKAELQACVDSVETKIAKYEELDQDAIIATYEEDYVKSTSEETGYLVYEIYQAAVKDIIAANNKFKAVNDTLASIQTAIDAAETVKALRLYEAATGKDALQAAIDKAKGVQTAMKAVDYSQENAAAITAANAELAEAVETFKASVPASAIATIVDIDFENDAVLNEETQLYSISGAAGSMEFSGFSTVDVPVEGVFEQGLWNNGEQQYKGYLRVGNGTGTVKFDPTADGSMGTSILKMNCDFFIQGLSNRFIGFYMKDESDSIVAGYYANYYNNTIDASSNLPIEQGNLKYGSGGSYDNGSPQGAEPATANPLAKNSFEVVLDFGEGSIYCTTTSDKGVVTTAKQAFDKSVPRSFVLQCNYDTKFASRRCWFDNLKIQRITAGATDPFVVDGIQEVNPVKVVAPSKVIKNGRLIINGKYGVNGMLIK